MSMPRAAETEIRELIDSRLRAVAAKDVDAVASEYGPDLVMFNLGPPLQHLGVDTEGIEAWFAAYRGATGCEVRDLRIVGDDRIGFCHYLYRITGTLKAGPRVHMWVRATLCLEKRDGRWLIVHEHDSDPFDFQTFEARLDLEP